MKNNGKVLLYIMLGLLILSIMIQLIQYAPKYKEVEKMQIVRAGIGFNEESKVTVLHSDCINGEVYFPVSRPTKMWIMKTDDTKPGKCYLRVKVRKWCVFC